MHSPTLEDLLWLPYDIQPKNNFSLCIQSWADTVYNHQQYINVYGKYDLCSNNSKVAMLKKATHLSNARGPLWIFLELWKTREQQLNHVNQRVLRRFTQKLCKLDKISTINTQHRYTFLNA